MFGVKGTYHRKLKRKHKKKINERGELILK
jgi:hypothetical protein